MSDPLYRRELLRLAADAHGAGRLERASARGSAFNPSCGDRVTVELDLAAGRVAALAHETRACVLAQASAAILGLALQGTDLQGVRKLHRDISAMLNGEAGVPAAPFDLYAAFDGVAEHSARHRCVLLPLDAVLDAFQRSESAEPGGQGTKA